MTFRGLHELSLDPKNRVNVPATYRPALANGLVLRPSVENCIELWPEDSAEEMEAKTLGELNPFSRDSRRMQRRIFSMSVNGKLDSAGRVLLSRELIESAGLEGKCVIAGAGTLGAAGYAAVQWFRRAPTHPLYAVLVFIAYVPLLFHIGSRMSVLFPIDVPRWMMPENAELYAFRLMSLPLAHALFVLVAASLPVGHRGRPLRDLLAAAAIMTSERRAGSYWDRRCDDR